MPLFADGGCVRVAYQTLVNPTSGSAWAARRNFCQPVLVRIYRGCVIVEAWLLSWCVEYVFSEHYCQAEVFYSGYMPIVEPFQSLQERPSLGTRPFTVRRKGLGMCLHSSCPYGMHLCIVISDLWWHHAHVRCRSARCSPQLSSSTLVNCRI